MASYKDLKASFEMLEDKEVNDDVTFRYWLLRLLFEINGNLDTLAFAYREMLTIQQKRQSAAVVSGKQTAKK